MFASHCADSRYLHVRHFLLLRIVSVQYLILRACVFALQELMSRTSLETQKLDLMDEVSYLKLKLVSMEESRSNAHPQDPEDTEQDKAEVWHVKQELPPGKNWVLFELLPAKILPRSKIYLQDANTKLMFCSSEENAGPVRNHYITVVQYNV